MESRSRRSGRRPPSFGDRLRREALPPKVAAKPALVEALRCELNRYAKRQDPGPIAVAIDEAFGSRVAAHKVEKVILKLSKLVRDAGLYASEALANAFPGDREAQRREFERWRTDLDAMATNADALGALKVKGNPGPKPDRPLYVMCSRVALHFRNHGLKVSKADTGLLAETLREMVRVAKGKVVDDIRPYLWDAVEDSRESILD